MGKHTLGDLTDLPLDGCRLTRVYWIISPSGNSPPCAVMRQDTKTLVVCDERWMAERILPGPSHTIVEELALLDGNGLAYPLSNRAFGSHDRESMLLRDGLPLLTSVEYVRLTGTAEKPFYCG